MNLTQNYLREPVRSKRKGDYLSFPGYWIKNRQCSYWMTCSSNSKLSYGWRIQRIQFLLLGTTRFSMIFCKEHMLKKYLLQKIELYTSLSLFLGLSLSVSLSLSLVPSIICLLLMESCCKTHQGLQDTYILGCSCEDFRNSKSHVRLEKNSALTLFIGFSYCLLWSGPCFSLEFRILPSYFSKSWLYFQPWWRWWLSPCPVSFNDPASLSSPPEF